MLYDLVEKNCYETDAHHAPYERIEAPSRNAAKAKYVEMYPEYRYIDILCRKSRKGSFDFFAWSYL
jgi:hypothetical protein